MQQNQVKRIVVIGPESTGKSTLCTLLADHFNTVWCPEFARDYLLTHGRDYSYDDLATIAQGQLALEDEYAAQLQQTWQWHDGVWINAHTLSSSPMPPMLFVDTDMYVMKVWCEYVFGQCHQLIIDQIVQRPYDLYLLCNIDLPWVQDELREYPDEKPRQELFEIYKDILINQQTPWVQIEGDYEARLATAIAAVNKYCAS